MRIIERSIMIPDVREIVGKWRKYLKREKGYEEEDLVSDLINKFTINGEDYEMRAELALRPDDHNFLILKCERPTRPLVPLERRTASIARIIDEKPFPFAILTNGFSGDSVFIDVTQGKTSYEFEVPSRSESLRILSKLKIPPVDERRVEKEKRIFATFNSLKCETCEDQ